MTTTLIGRETELKQLNQILQKAVKGKLQIVFVTGEAGIGKTALVSTFLQQAKSNFPDLFTASSKCQAIAGSQQDPYLPFVRILEQIATAKKDNKGWERLRRGIVELGPDWLQILPGAGNLMAAVMRTAQWGQRELSQQGEGIDLSRRQIQYTNILRLTAETTPLLLYIDDLHWADTATLDLISFIADYAADIRLMLVATYRPTDIAHGKDGQSHPVKLLIQRLQRYKLATEIHVPNFTRQNLEAFLEHSQHQLPEPFKERIWQQSGGNPLFIREYVILLHDKRLLKRQKGAYVLVGKEVAIEVPTTVQHVIEQRLGLIAQELRRALAYASVQGERFTSKVLAELLASSELDLLERLNLLERVHNLIRELEEQHLVVRIGAEYQFVHVLIQQVLYNDLSQAQHAQLHLAIAQLLENLYGENARIYATDLAFHFERGKNVPKAIAYYLQAGENALAVLALDEALTAAQKVLELSKSQQPSQALGWQLDALIQIAEAKYNQAQYDEALAVCNQGLDLSNAEHFVGKRVYLLYWCAKITQLSRNIGMAWEFLKEAIELLDVYHIENVPLQAKLYAMVGSFYNLLPLEQVQFALDQAILLANQHDLPDIKAFALINKSWIALNHTDTPLEALTFGQEALKNAQTLYYQMYSHRLLANAYRRLNRHSEALWHNQQAVQIAKQSGSPRSLHMALYSLAFSYQTYHHDILASLQMMVEAVDVANQYGFPVSQDVSGAYVDLAISLGLWEKAQAIQIQYRTRIDDTYPRSWGYYYRREGQLARARGQFQEAVNFYQQAQLTFVTPGVPIRTIQIGQIRLGFSLIATNQFEEASSLLKESLNYWQGQKHEIRIATCLWGLGQIDLAHHQPSEALAKLQEALLLVEGKILGSEIWPTWLCVCMELGRTYLVLGEFDKGLAQAMVAYDKLKQMQHFLYGEAAFTVGTLLVAQGKKEEARLYLYEARDEWQRLELTYHLPNWEAFMATNGLVA